MRWDFVYFRWDGEKFEQANSCKRINEWFECNVWRTVAGDVGRKFYLIKKRWVRKHFKWVFEHELESICENTTKCWWDDV